MGLKPPKEYDTTTPEERAEREKESRHLLGVATRVMAGLGQPPDFLKATAARVSGNTYRVNVFTRDYGRTELLAVPTRRISDSFFVWLDGEDRLHAEPPLTKKYKEKTRAELHVEL